MCRKLQCLHIQYIFKSFYSCVQNVISWEYKSRHRNKQPCIHWLTNTLIYNYRGTFVVYSIYFWQSLSPSFSSRRYVKLFTPCSITLRIRLKYYINMHPPYIADDLHSFNQWEKYIYTYIYTHDSVPLLRIYIYLFTNHRGRGTLRGDKQG